MPSNMSKAAGPTFQAGVIRVAHVGTLELRCQGKLRSVSAPRARHRRHVLLHVCSSVAVLSDCARYNAAAELAELRTKRHRQALAVGSRAENFGLLIRGFGVQVPGGAPVLTWHFCYLFALVTGRFPAMSAPCLLASPDIVDHARRLPGEAPADGYTQRDIQREAAAREPAGHPAQEWPDPHGRPRRS